LRVSRLHLVCLSNSRQLFSTIFSLHELRLPASPCVSVRENDMVSFSLLVALTAAPPKVVYTSPRRGERAPWVNHENTDLHDHQNRSALRRTPRAPAWTCAAGFTIDFTSRIRNSGKEKVKKR
jgi:hypothetical protein